MFILLCFFFNNFYYYYFLVFFFFFNLMSRIFIRQMRFDVNHHNIAHGNVTHVKSFTLHIDTLFCSNPWQSPCFFVLILFKLNRMRDLLLLLFFVKWKVLCVMIFKEKTIKNRTDKRNIDRRKHIHFHVILLCFFDWLRHRMGEREPIHFIICTWFFVCLFISNAEIGAKFV